MTKVFGVGELLARIRVALRRSAQGEAGASEFTMGDVKLDLVRRRVTKSEVEVHLTPIEFKLLTTLVKNEGRVITHRQLLSEVWGRGASEQTQYLRVYMGQLLTSWKTTRAARGFLRLTPASATGSACRISQDVAGRRKARGGEAGWG